MTIFVHDTFTGGGNVSLYSHVGEVGATWSSSTYRGSEDGDHQLRVTGGALQQTDYTGGERYAFPNGVITPGPIRITLQLKLNAAYTNFQIIDSLYGTSWGGGGPAEPGDGEEITIRVDDVYISNYDTIDSGSFTYAAPFVAGVAREVIIETDGTSLSVAIDGAPVVTVTMAAAPVPPFLFGVWTANDLGTNVQLSELTVESFSAGPPPAPPVFWTGFVKSHETL